MTVNGVRAVILRHFIEFGSFVTSGLADRSSPRRVLNGDDIDTVECIVMCSVS